MRFCCLVVRTKIIGRTFHSLHEEEIGELLAKNIYSKNSKNTAGRMTSATWRIFAELKNPFSPKLADKQYTIKDELNIDGDKHVLPFFF